MHRHDSSKRGIPGDPVALFSNEGTDATVCLRWHPPSADHLASLLPQFQVELLLGAGGMGAVYLGTQLSLHRRVAIKLLPAELAGSADFVSKFKREARTLARLQHPGIVAVHDFGQTSEGHLFFIMEYVDGTDLARLIHSPGLEASQALEITIQVCEALHYAHDQGVIHRDIKPPNVLITQDGRAKLADFGLARPVSNLPGEITATRLIMGTPEYMAPEQWQGGEDHRADIYALGVMLYEMLTGSLPRGTFDLPSQKSKVDSRLDEVVIKAMRQKPEQRYQAVSEMRDAVRRIRTTQPMPDGARQAENATAQLAQFGWQDRFTLQEKIGKGGSGQVWRAWDHELGQIVALKLLVPERQGDEGAMARIEGEADTLRRLHSTHQHPNVVKVFDFAMAEDQVCLVMQYVAGQTLTAQPLPTMRDAAALLRTVSDACGWFHQLGVIHRDLKPENIMIAEGSGAPVIIDFSIAKDEALMTLTLTQQALGTAAYMAPEQFGTGQGRITPAADVFALGVILYELLTGHPPYTGDYFEIYQQKTTGQRPPFPRLIQTAIPRALEAIVWQALSPSSADRYADGDALAEDLGRWLDGRRVQAPHIPRRRHLAARIHPWLPRPLTALVAAVFIGTPLGWFSWPWLAQTSTPTQNHLLAAARTQNRPLAAAPTLTSEPTFKVEEGFTDLFAPEEASFWTGDGRGGFILKDGVATSRVHRIDPLAGLWIYQKHAFSDFVLRLQFLADEPYSNSGVFVRCTPGKNGFMQEAFQVHIGGDDSPKPSGSIWNYRTARLSPLRIHGTWNDLEMRVEGPMCQVTLNGQVVTDWNGGAAPKAQAGLLALQFHYNGPVQFRRVRILPLKPPQAMPLPPAITERLDRERRHRTGQLIPGIDDVFPPLAGSWRVVFQSGEVRHYRIHPDGRMRIVEQGGLIAFLQARDGQAVLDEGKDTLARFSLNNGVLQVERWAPGSRLGTGQPTDSGMGTQIKDQEVDEIEVKLKEFTQTLRENRWLYQDEGYPDSEVRFGTDGRFHDRWRWRYWIMQPGVVHVQYSEGPYDPAEAVRLVFDAEYKSYQGSFTDPRGRLHRLSGKRL